VTLTERCAAYERRFLTRSKETQEALIGIARSLVLVLGPGGGVPTEDITDLLDILTNAGGKIQRGLKTEGEVLAEIQDGAPTVAARFLEGLG